MIKKHDRLWPRRGRAAQRSIVIELKSVNNRYLDCSVRLPRSCSFAGGGY